MTQDSIIALVASGAAMLAAIYAASSARSAKRSADIAEKEYLDSKAGVQAYLIDAFSWTDAGSRRMVAIGCTITNLSTAQTSIVRADLRIHEYRPNEAPACVILQPQAADLPTQKSHEKLVAPINITQRGTVSGWLIFHVPEAISSNRIIDKYELNFTTATGGRTSISTHIMRHIESHSNAQ